MAEDMMPKPSVGRIVHYREEAEGPFTDASPCLAAVITEVITDTGNRVGLRVWMPDQDVRRFNISEGTEDNTWHWPERV